jgi:hypothetical protein
MSDTLLAAYPPGDEAGLRALVRSLTTRPGWQVHEYAFDNAALPGVEIARRAADLGARLVVVPLEVGPVTQSGLLRRSRSPVLWLPNTTRLPTSVAAALDGRRWSGFVLDAAHDAAALLDAELHVVTVQPHGDHPQVQEILRLLDARPERLLPLEVVAGADAGEALPADRADTLLAVGVHRGGSDDPAIGDQTARRVLARASAPVLTVPL